MSQAVDGFELKILGERDGDDEPFPKSAGRREETRFTTSKVSQRANRPPPVFTRLSLPKDGGFEFRDISYTTPAGKTLIQGISATVGKGEMLAIMVCRSLLHQNHC
jgi:ABC-type multidrug transport system fused ATPase/permease subunit